MLQPAEEPNGLDSGKHQTYLQGRKERQARRCSVGSQKVFKVHTYPSKVWFVTAAASNDGIPGVPIWVPNIGKVPWVPAHVLCHDSVPPRSYTWGSHRRHRLAFDFQEGRSQQKILQCFSICAHA